MTGAQIKPILAHSKVLVCRPEPAASELASVLRSVGANAKTLPCIAIEPTAVTPETLLTQDRTHLQRENLFPFADFIRRAGFIRGADFVR